VLLQLGNSAVNSDLLSENHCWTIWTLILYLSSHTITKMLSNVELIHLEITSKYFLKLKRFNLNYAIFFLINYCLVKSLFRVLYSLSSKNYWLPIIKYCSMSSMLLITTCLINCGQENWVESRLLLNSRGTGISVR
jgi:hypothetical protein